MRKYMVAAVLLVLAGCSSESPAASTKATGAQPWLDDTKAAASAGRIGGSGTGCAMPVTFEVAKSWKPKAIEPSPDESLEALFRQGSYTAVCEIDAKPAGNLGFLRVWADSKSSADGRAALEAFVKSNKYATEPEYREFKAGSVTGAEVTYLLAAPESDKKRERALAVPTPKGAVVLHLGGLDTEEHEQMLPAYVLAKQTLQVP
jgi:hypothetical protein